MYNSIYSQISNKHKHKYNGRNSNKFIKNLTILINNLTQNSKQLKKMSQYILSTPQPSNTSQKHLYNTSASLNTEDECQYCIMKRKFNIGSTGDQKCFQHSVKINIQQSEDQQNSQQKNQYMPVQEMVLVLEDVQNGLDYYWDHLRQLSGGNTSFIHKELDPVQASLKRLQQKMSKFFYDNPMDISQIKPVQNQSMLHRKLPNTGSQKYLRVDLSHFLDSEQSNPTQSIKQWVMHFHKMLQMRDITQTADSLPYQGDLQMRIFKQSMQRKFIQYVELMKGYQKKVRDVLSKLVYYMQKCTDNVPDKQIQQDILFIEGQHQGILQTRQVQLQRLLLIQANTMQMMLINGPPA